MSRIDELVNSVRQTGRSTNGLKAALEYSRETGNTTLYVVSSQQQIKYMQALLEYIGGNRNDWVRIVTINHQFQGYSPEQVFVDHHVFEVGIHNPSLQTLVRRWTLAPADDVGAAIAHEQIQQARMLDNVEFEITMGKEADK